MSSDLYTPLSNLLEYEEIDNIERPALVTLTKASLIYNQESYRTAISSPPKIVRNVPKPQNLEVQIFTGRTLTAYYEIRFQSLSENKPTTWSTLEFRFRSRRITVLLNISRFSSTGELYRVSKIKSGCQANRATWHQIGSSGRRLGLDDIRPRYLKFTSVHLPKLGR